MMVLMFDVRGTVQGRTLFTHVLLPAHLLACTRTSLFAILNVSEPEFDAPSPIYTSAAI